ncbi:hypothetical protein PIB30_012196 [Stylosanthes scabra]|uniref:F-box domain-containing protein n=1 Tax=Stylosanthes scabra TaxID=79078 RepID=A0ABU6U4T0_9FABA|nr:hypothetical protein [Stylosanthes scabra]
MDQISGLPKIILHNILSKLPTKDAARTSILSKEWRKTWLTFPILDFCDTLVMGEPPYDEVFLSKKNIFVDYVKKTLQRFCDRGLAIKKFKLTLNCLDFEDLSHQHLDLWLKLACESGVKTIEVYLSDADDIGQWYIFPPSLLEAKSLNKLVLMGEIKIDLEFLNHSNRFFSLQELSLWSVLLPDEREFERFISRCPLIEHITLRGCCVYKPPTIWDQQVSWTSPLKSISMRSLQKLKVFDVQGIQEVYIDAPNLESLCYIRNSRDVPYKLDFDSCRNLRLLHLWSWNSTVLSDKWFIELFSKFPFLESLKFENFSISESINISNAQLKVLVFSNCCNLKEVNIDAPNLISCGFFGGPLRRAVSFLSSSSQLEVHIDSPNLENLSYCPLDSNAPVKLNFDSCTKLRCLCLNDLKSTIISDKWFLELFSKYPLLESLKLCNFPMSERINIKSAQLKVLKLYHCSNLKEVNIDAPHLISLDYHCGFAKPVISLMKYSNKLEVHVDTCVDYRLRDFIQNIPEKVLASLSLIVRSYRDDPYLPAFQVSSIPARIKHLDFGLHAVQNSNEALYGPLMNCLLSSCFPEKISFRFILGNSTAFIEFFYEMLMGSKKGECHCSSGNTKCWWHALKVVKISRSFPPDKFKTITYSLEM